MSTINTEAIDKINEQLDKIIDYMDFYSENIQNIVDGAGAEAQKILDDEVNKFNKKISEELTKIRNKIVDIFRGQYQIALKKLEPIKPLIDVNLSLDTVVSVVKSIIDIITAPYQPLIEFTTEIIPKVLELSNKLQQIASYKPTIPIPPHLNMPKIEIKVDPITPKDIM